MLFSTHTQREAKFDIEKVNIIFNRVPIKKKSNIE